MGAKRKLSLSEKLQASPESILIDRQNDEAYLTNLQNYSFGHFEFGLITSLCLVTGILSLSILNTVLLTLALVGFVFALPRLFLNFKKCFTFGEGCLLMQALFTYTAHSLIQLNSSHQTEDKPGMKKSYQQR